MDTTDIRKRTRSHLIAFAAILVLALVAAAPFLLANQTNSYLVVNPYFILSIAVTQAAIILTAMMHARAEGPWVRGTLAFAAIFVAVMLGLFLLGKSSTIEGTQVLNVAPAAAHEEAH